jgi:hypothetical protein
MFVSLNVDPEKKYYVQFLNGPKIRFGQKNARDFTSGADEKDRENYIKRHFPRENWHNPYSAGFWSRWLLWEKRTIAEAIDFIYKNFGINFI